MSNCLCVLLFGVISIAMRSQELLRLSHSIDNAWGVYYADIDRDGKDDIISHSPYGIFWSRNLGSGDFEKSVFLIEFDEASISLRAVADFDNDTDIDFLIATQYTNLQFFRCDGDNIYHLEALGSTNGSVTSIVTDDLNLDGQIDLVTMTENGIQTWINTGELNFTETNVLDNNPNTWSTARVLDIDVDGDNDLFITKGPSGNCYISTNDGQGHFSNIVMTLLPGSAGLLKYADFNQDGFADLVFFHQENNDLLPGPEPASIQYYWNDGNNQFTSSDVTAIPLSEGYYRGASIHDWNEDGTLDLVLVYVNNDDEPLDYSERYYQHRYYTISADLSMNLEKTTDCNFYLPWLYEDLNEDGHKDGIYYDTSQGVVGWLDYSDSQTDVFHRLDQSIGASNSVFVEDLNGDNLEDILVYNSAEAGVGIYYNSPTGYEAVQLVVDTQYLIDDFKFLDLDGDGDGDFVISSAHQVDDGGLYGLNNNGTFTLTNFTHPVAENFTQNFADINNDGRVDYLYVTLSNIVVYFSSATGFFDGAAVPLNIPGGFVEVFDFNNDGLNDIMTGSGNSYNYYLSVDSSGLNYELHPELSPMMGPLPFVKTIYYNDDELPDLLFAGTTSTRIALAQENGYAASFEGPNFNQHHKWCDYDHDGLSDYYFRYQTNSWLMMKNMGGTFEAIGTFYGPTDIQEIKPLFPSSSPQILDWKNRQLFLGPLQLIPDPLFVQGYVFWDTNIDGIHDSGEPLLDMPFEIISGDSSYYTSATGQFYYIGDGSPALITLPYDTSIWQLTTDSVSYMLSGDSSEWNQILVFGLTPLNTLSDIHLALFATDFTCSQNTIVVQVCISNHGNTLESGTVQLNWDQTIFPLISTPENAEPTDEGFAIAVEDLLPNEHVHFTFEMVHPGVAYMDSLFAANATYSNASVSVSTNWQAPIVCAYDPNMVINQPSGMSTQGFVLPIQTMEYTIHFQNLGSAPASTVRIENNYSPWLDYTQLEIIASSHPMAYYFGSGHAQFLFDNINLVQANLDEQQSRGFVTYRIPIRSNAPKMLDLPNAALIFFDLNPAIATNLVCNQVFDCQLMDGWDLTTNTFCIHDTLMAHATGDYISESNWYLDQSYLYSGDQVQQTWIEPGTKTLTLECVNELCTVYKTTELIIPELPSPAIVQTDNILSIETFEQIQWQLNGENIEGAIGNSYEITSNGTYAVTVFDSHGCSNTSTTALHQIDQFVYYPNPHTAGPLLVIIAGTMGNLRLYDSTGRITWEQKLAHWNQFTLPNLAAGIYTIIVEDEIQRYEAQQIVIE